MCDGMRFEFLVVRLLCTTQRFALDALNAHPMCDDVCRVVTVDTERCIKVSKRQHLFNKHLTKHQTISDYSQSLMLAWCVHKKGDSKTYLFLFGCMRE